MPEKNETKADQGEGGKNPVADGASSPRPAQDSIGKAYETPTEIIVCGEPPDEPEDLPEAEYAQWYEGSHNCDAMGCGYEHVIYRFAKTQATASSASDAHLRVVSTESSLPAQTWKCACGWSGQLSDAHINASDGRVCPDCGASGELILSSDSTAAPAPVGEMAMAAAKEIATNVDILSIGKNVSAEGLEDAVVAAYADVIQRVVVRPLEMNMMDHECLLADNSRLATERDSHLALIKQMREALAHEHRCFTLRSDGWCEGCATQDAIKAADAVIRQP